MKSITYLCTARSRPKQDNTANINTLLDTYGDPCRVSWFNARKESPSKKHLSALIQTHNGTLSEGVVDRIITKDKSLADVLAKGGHKPSKKGIENALGEFSASALDPATPKKDTLSSLLRLGEGVLSQCDVDLAFKNIVKNNYYQSHNGTFLEKQCKDNVKVFLEGNPPPSEAVQQLIPLEIACAEHVLAGVKAESIMYMLNHPPPSPPTSKEFLNASLVAAVMLCKTDDKARFGMLHACLEKGAEVNAKDQDGQTVLHHAARRGSTLLIHMLGNAGAKNTKDQHGKTPADSAMEALWACREQRHTEQTQDNLRATAGTLSLGAVLWLPKDIESVIGEFMKGEDLCQGDLGFVETRSGRSR